MEKTKKEKKPLMTKNEKEFVCTLFALIIIAIFFIATPPSGLSADGMKVLGVFISVLFLWITVGIGWPSLLCLATLALVPSLGMKTTLQNSFGNETFAFLLFTFMFTYAFSQTGYVKKIALGFVTSKFARKTPWRFAFCFFAAVLVIGLFMSPTVLYFIILPILEEIYNVLGLKKGDKYANMLMMGLVFCTSLSSGMTPIAHVFPVLSMGVFKSLTGSSISYGQYMLYAIPTGIIIFALMMLVFKFLMRPNTKKINLKSNEFDKMKDGVYIVNTARGELLDIKALYDNLIKGKVKAAALDVLECEFLSTHPGELTNVIENSNSNCVETALITQKLFKMDNVIITPHIAYNTNDSVNYLLEKTFNNIRDYLKGLKTNRVC